MKIQDINYKKYKISLKKVFKNNKQEYLTREVLIIKIISQTYAGKGEVAPLDGFSKETFREIILGLQTFIESIYFNADYMFDEILNLAEIHCSKIPTLHFAIDTALYDIESQKKQVSISKILNPKCKNQIKLSSIYLFDNQIKNIKSDYIKYKLGIQDIDQDIKILNLINQYNQSINFRFDANQAYTLAEFQQIYKKLSHLNIEYFEEPIKTPNRQKLQKLQNINVAIDESIYTNDDYGNWIKMGLIKFVIIKPSILGGYNKFCSLVEKCKLYNIKIILSSALENSIGNMATIQLAAALNNRASHGLDIYNFYDKFFHKPIYKKNQSTINLKNVVGLGL